MTHREGEQIQEKERRRNGKKEHKGNSRKRGMENKQQQEIYVYSEGEYEHNGR